MVSTTLINGLFLKDECGSCKRNVWCHKIITIINMNIWLHERMSYECVIPFFFFFSSSWSCSYAILLWSHRQRRSVVVSCTSFHLVFTFWNFILFSVFLRHDGKRTSTPLCRLFFLHSLDAYVQWLGLGILYSYLCCACPFNSFHCLIMEQYACIV